MTPHRKLALALFASLAVNLFLATWVVAHLLRHDPRGGRAGFPAPEASVVTELALGPRRPPAAVRELLQGARPQLRAERAALVEAQEAVLATLRTEPLEVPKLEAALNDLRTATLQSQQSLHRHFVEAAPRLTPAERTELGAFVLRSNAPAGKPARGDGRGGRHRGWPAPPAASAHP